MSERFSTLKLDQDGPLLTLTLHRPAVLNALNSAVLEELGTALHEAEVGGEVRAIVLTGAGEKAFVAGADISEMASFTAAEADAFARKGQAVMDQLAGFPGVTLAAVNGFALGGGCELALACDLLIAASNARFGQPEVSLGVIPGFGGTQRLVRRVGLQRATEMVLTGRTLKADEALSVGLCLKVVEEGQAVFAAQDLARTILGKGPSAVRLAKKALEAGSELDLARGLAQEASLFALCFATSDQKEGMSAFLQKRPAAFTGR